MNQSTMLLPSGRETSSDAFPGGYRLVSGRKSAQDLNDDEESMRGFFAMYQAKALFHVEHCRGI